jgi:Holliday junction resolvase RusA-like endonuclease
MIALTTPLPPSLNNCYTNGRGHGRRVLTKQGRDYKEAVAELLLGRYQPLPSGARIGLSLRFWFKNKQRTDISNRVKLLEDALSEALGFDDCCVDDLHVVRAGYDAAQPRCEVVIEVLG